MVDSFKKDEEQAKRIAKLHEWLDAKEATGSLEAIATDLHQIRQMFLEEVGSRLHKPINDYLLQLPQSTGSEKSRLCTFLNGLLASYDLGIVDPTTHRIGILIADSSHGNVAGRFRINVPDATRTRRVTPTAFEHLPSLKFCPRLNHDARQPWTELIRQQVEPNKIQR